MIRFLKISGIITGTTLGAGVFALPYIFLRSGSTLSFFYLVALGAIIAGAHALYWKTLLAVDGKEHLIGLARNNLGKFWYWSGVFSIVAGLIFALVIYLILGNGFIQLFLPGISPLAALLGFWAISALPLFFREARVLNFELLAIILMVGIILMIFFAALPTRDGFAPPVLPTIDFRTIFLPFGIVLFSLAGWTAIRPLYASEGEAGEKKTPVAALFISMFFIAALYLMFIWGIFWSAGEITEDTISGLLNWPAWKRGILGILGVFALWTSYLPIGLEARSSLVNDLRIRKPVAFFITIFLPLLLVLGGLDSFLRVVGLAGGVFLAIQYILIGLVAGKVLALRGAAKVFLNILIAVFALAAVYEFYYFVAAD